MTSRSVKGTQHQDRARHSRTEGCPVATQRAVLLANRVLNGKGGSRGEAVRGRQGEAAAARAKKTVLYTPAPDSPCSGLAQETFKICTRYSSKIDSYAQSFLRKRSRRATIQLWGGS